MAATAQSCEVERDRTTRPLRVSVIGSSVGYYVRPPEDSTKARPYPELLEDLLRDVVANAEVLNHSSWFLMAPDAFRTIQQTVLPRGADVVVVNLGILEAEPTVLPTALIRSVYSWRPPTGRIAATGRRLVLRPVHLFHLHLAPKIMRRVRTFHRLSPRRFELELTRLVEWLRKERRALVLVLNINPAGDNVEKTLPGTQESVRAYNRIIERVVGGLADPQVRLVDVARMVEDGDRDELLPDGIHYSATGHRKVAELLVREIQAWLDGQADGGARLR